MKLIELIEYCENAFKTNIELWFDQDGFPVFDFPEYGGLPEKISSILSSDCVDCIQSYLSYLSGPEEFEKNDLLSCLEECKKSGWAIPF